MQLAFDYSQSEIFKRWDEYVENQKDDEGKKVYEKLKSSLLETTPIPLNLTGADSSGQLPDAPGDSFASKTYLDMTLAEQIAFTASVLAKYKAMHDKADTLLNLTNTVNSTLQQALSLNLSSVSSDQSTPIGEESQTVNPWFNPSLTEDQNLSRLFLNSLTLSVLGSLGVDENAELAAYRSESSSSEGSVTSSTPENSVDFESVDLVVREGDGTLETTNAIITSTTIDTVENEPNNEGLESSVVINPTDLVVISENTENAEIN
jgi:hypothetical protein